MTQEQTKNTLPPDLEGEEEPMMITCMECGNLRQVEVNPTFLEMSDVAAMLERRRTDVLRGTLRCSQCSTETAFELTGGHLTFIQSKGMYPALDSKVAPNAKEMFHEAIRCFQGTSYRGVVAMCRSALWEALDAKNVKGRELDPKIKNARKLDPPPSGKPNGFLEDDWVARSHGARLTGNYALHRMARVELHQAQLALAATADLVNHIAEQPAMPEGTDSSES